MLGMDLANDGNLLDSEFQNQVKFIGSKLQDLDIKVKLFADSEIFNTLEIDTKRNIVDHLRKYCEVIDNIKLVSSNMDEDLRFIWSAIKTFNIIPPSDFLSTYKKGYLFELYDNNGVQFFRNFEFFTVCSYSLEELFCKPWYKLYKREEIFTNEMIKIASDCTSGKIQGSVYNALEPHTLTEVASDFINQATVEIKAFVPMNLKNSSLKCVAAITHCKNLVSLVNSVEPMKAAEKREDSDFISHLKLV